MIRIVGIERSSDAQNEFILLQNQGHMRAHLRGHAIIADKCLPKTNMFSPVALCF
jgi:hypothetical protein